MASAPFVIDTTTPTDTSFQSIFPSNERTFRDVVDSWLKFEHNTAGGHDQVGLSDQDGTTPTFSTGVVGLWQEAGVLKTRTGSGTVTNMLPSSVTKLNTFTDMTTTGLVTQTSEGVYNARSVAVSGDGLQVTNGDGVAGNPTVALDDDVAAIEALTGTGLLVHTAAGTWTERTITAGTDISIVNGNGVSGNPTISVSGTFASYTTSSSAALTNYPVGTVLLVESGLFTPSPNEVGSIYLKSGSTGFQLNAIGTLLTGTWRCRGHVNSESVLFQRVA